jgi:hypothetical protein
MSKLHWAMIYSVQKATHTSSLHNGDCRQAEPVSGASTKKIEGYLQWLYLMTL